MWEPILPTDLAPPITSVLSRLSDRRVQQYWDPGYDQRHPIELRLDTEAGDRQQTLADIEHAPADRMPRNGRLTAGRNPAIVCAHRSQSFDEGVSG